MTGDPNRQLCGNCGEPWEDHESLRWYGQWQRFCRDGSSNNFRPESDEDRIADRAGSMGL